MCIQELIQKELETERETQAESKKAAEQAQQAHDEKAAEVKVRVPDETSSEVYTNSAQIIEADTKALEKELAVFDKQEVQMQEQCKHHTIKQKKLKKSVADVHYCYFPIKALADLLAGFACEIRSYD